MIVKWLLLFVITIYIKNVQSWQTCADTFCDRLRNSPEGIDHRYYINGAVNLENDKIVASLKTDKPAGAPLLQLQISIHNNEIIRVSVDETGTSKRFRPTVALLPNIPTPSKLTITDNSTSAIVTSAKIKLEITKTTLNIKIYNGNHLFSEINPQNNFVFETIKDKSIAMGVMLYDVERAYGIPEHAEHLALKSTKTSGEPYRHFNVDYGYYKLESRESLYGSIGVLYGHGTKHSAGVFWLNAAQTWIDIENSPDTVDAFFMSESGVVDMFVLAGPTLPQAVQQYTQLTGTAPLPQYFTLGYHQSRYSYMSQDEVLDVVKNLDDHDMPVDVIWLDIDYTNEKMYFTWDPKRFADPDILINSLATTKRKLVAIIDPHIKVETGYMVHDEATTKGYYIKNDKGTVYQADCWPGLSSYLDFLNPDALNYYSSLYSKYHFENPNVHLWNDMNEPAVFNGEENEKTVPPTAKHYGGWEHRDVHNVYGFYQTMGTKAGMIKAKADIRPFILTRSHFAGVQRYAAVWTGDNAATWDYLQMSFPMCLTEALAGVSFCGADVGGFFEIPEDELYQRWYQAGAWLPFYRGHSTIDVPRREPYLFSDGVQERVRAALYQRYAHMPTWYTLFYEHETIGHPVIRPVTYHYPEEADALSIENQVLVGENILAAPVLEKGVLQTTVYLPGGDQQTWFNIDDGYKPFNGSGFQSIDVTLDSTPVFYRAGSIISRKNIKQKTSVDTHGDPFTLYVCLDEDGNAEGTLYVDDYSSFKYQTKQFLYVKFSFSNSTLTLSHMKDGKYNTAVPIYEIIFINLKLVYDSAVSVSGEETSNLNATFSAENNTFVMKDFNIALSKPSKIEFNIAASSSAKIQLSLLQTLLTIIFIIYN